MRVTLTHLVAAALGAGCGVLSTVYVVLLHDQDKPKQQPKRYAAWISSGPWNGGQPPEQRTF